MRTNFMPIVPAALLPALFLAAGCGGQDYSSVEAYPPEVEARHEYRMPAEEDDAGEEEQYQVLVVLHEDGGTEQDVLKWWDEGKLFLPDFALIAVRAPFRGGSGYAWTPANTVVEEGEDPLLPRVAAARTAERVILDAVHDFARKHVVDVDDINIAGLGASADVAWFVALRNTDLFSGIASLYGRGIPRYAPELKPQSVEFFDVFIAVDSAQPAAVFEAARRDASRMVRAGAVVDTVFTNEPLGVSPALLRAMENFFELAGEDAPLNDRLYDEDGVPLDGLPDDVIEDEWDELLDEFDGGDLLEEEFRDEDSGE